METSHWTIRIFTFFTYTEGACAHMKKCNFMPKQETIHNKIYNAISVVFVNLICDSHTLHEQSAPPVWNYSDADFVIIFFFLFSFYYFVEFPFLCFFFGLLPVRGGLAQNIRTESKNIFFFEGTLRCMMIIWLLFFFLRWWRMTLCCCCCWLVSCLSDKQDDTLENVQRDYRKWQNK